MPTALGMQEFGINLHIPWTAGTQSAPSWNTPGTQYTNTKEIEAGGATGPSSSERPDKDGFVSVAAGCSGSILPARRPGPCSNTMLMSGIAHANVSRQFPRLVGLTATQLCHALDGALANPPAGKLTM
eukprot:7714369-Pyramimonas_sp.AAC.3